MARGPSAEDSPAAQYARHLHSRHPRFLTAVAADARATSANRGVPLTGLSRAAVLGAAVKLAWESDAFAAQACYRAKARLQALGVPILPRICHRLAMILGGLRIGDHVLLGPGAHLAHGPLVIDGLVEIGPGVKIFPFVTVGLRAGDLQGPRLGARVTVGTGAKLIGPITVGDDATIGANAVVIEDVAAGATVVGIPATAAKTRAD